jgi:hypothetical protein
VPEEKKKWGAQVESEILSRIPSGQGRKTGQGRGTGGLVTSKCRAGEMGKGRWKDGTGSEDQKGCQVGMSGEALISD